MGADGSEAEKKGRLGRMEVIGPRGSFLTGGWCRPFKSARLGVPQIGFFGALGGLGPGGGTAAQPQVVGSRGLPNSYLQVRDLCEVGIACDESEVVFHCNGGDPDVVFWNGLSFESQCVLDAAI